MALIAEFTLHDPLVLVSTLRAVPTARCDVENIHYVPDPAGNVRIVLFCWVSGCDFSSLDAALDDDPTIEAFRVVTDIDHRHLYRFETKTFPPEQPLIVPFFRRHDTTWIDASLTEHGLELKARFPHRDAVKAFLEAAESIAGSVTIEGLYTEIQTNDTATITARQRQALTLALEHGYFESPSQTDLDTLAKQLDITPQTLSRHVRLGVKAAVTSALSDER